MLGNKWYDYVCLVLSHSMVPIGPWTCMDILVDEFEAWDASTLYLTLSCHSVFYLSTWKHVLMPADLLFVPLGLIYCRCHHFYATVKRPAVFPLVHTPMYLTYFGVICPMCVIPTNGEPRLKNQIKNITNLLDLFSLRHFIYYFVQQL